MRFTKVEKMTRPATKQKSPSPDVLTIDGAYGLVQGVYGNADMDSDYGYRKFKDEKIQALAMKAAAMFLRELTKLGEPRVGK